MWSNVLLPRLALGIRSRTAANAAFATTYSLAFDGHPNWLSRRGARWGAGAGAIVLAGYAAALAIPPLRTRITTFTDRAPEVPLTEWVLLHIPVGTVYSEELIFRATLDPLLAPAGNWLGPLTFGLWHIHPARATGDNVLASIAATTAAGLIFSCLRRHTDSTTAPALLHLALNAGGALVPHLATHLNPTELPAPESTPPRR